MPDVIVLVVWNLTALVALAVALVGTGGALADWEYLRERRLNGLRQIQAGANLRGQLIRALVSLLFLLIGLLVLLDVPHRVTASRWMLIAASLALTVGSVMDWLSRRELIRLLIDQEHDDENPLSSPREKEN